jgi:uncharacterized protein YndB with AHSA1/START domain
MMDSLTKSVLLPCGLDRAFTLFTEHASEWWPADRRHTGDASSEIRMLASGRFFERGRDGKEVELGRVRDWLPPRRIVLDWYPGTDAVHPTAVIITFAPEGDSTRITIVHTATPESADLWSPRAPRYAKSWDLVLAALEASVTPVLPIES